MNYPKNLLLLVLAIGLFSCSSSDDSDSGDNPPSVTGDYFPSSANNFWNYTVVNTSESDPAGNFTAADNLAISSSSGDSFTLEVNGGTAPANGTLNALLVNGTLTATETSLNFDGVLQGPPGYENFIDQQIVLNNVVLYDLSASDNEELSINSETLEQDLTVGQETYPLTINYSFTSKRLGFSNSETVSGETYSNVIKTEMTLRLDISTSIEVIGTVNISVIDSQDVLTIEAWYAQDIGLIAAYSHSGYQLSSDIIDLSQPPFNLDLGIPESDSSTNAQELHSYSLN